MPRPSQLLVLACFLAACSAHQPPVPEEPTGIGRLEVVVVDGADKQPLPAARVTLSHARGYVKDTTVQADGNGIASFPVLRPGDGYRIRVLLSDYAEYDSGDAVRVAAGTSAVVHVALLPSLKEVVRVTGRTETVDLAENARKTTFGSEFIQDLPVPGRFYQKVLTLAPGADDASGGFAATVAGVSNQDPRAGGPDEGPPGEASFAPLAEPGFVHTADQATSTFGVDVDRASYALTRRYLLEWKKRPPKNAVRLEELVNYFSYAYPEPPGGAAMAVSVDDAPAPWAPEHRLVRIGLQARRGETARLPASTLVFLVDVSGSMEAPDRLPLVKQALAFLAEELRPEDRLALVAYADRAWVVLPATAGDRKAEILDALDALEPGGGTAGASGLELAYQVAERARRPKDNARVVLATDGDFNVGASSPEELVSLIERHRARRIALSVLGVGSGADLQDARMEIIADRGDGNYAYADTVREARRALVEEMGGTLTTVARDVKIQVTFNPAQVQAWRLLGYENRALAREDFEDDSKDAGEMGAGHAVTALYEITPEVPGEPSVAVPEWMTVEVRWQPPQGGPSELLQVPAVLGKDTSSPDFRFASAVAEFALLLRDSPYKGQASLEAAIDRARAIVGDEPEGPRAELIALMEAYRTAP